MSAVVTVFTTCITESLFKRRACGRTHIPPMFIVMLKNAVNIYKHEMGPIICIVRVYEMTFMNFNFFVVVVVLFFFSLNSHVNCKLIFLSCHISSHCIHKSQQFTSLGWQSNHRSW